ncbi:hypothetical protein LMH73_004825 [Vibrio splendidus]|nr:hypothetical protein [Vibrio splendidus]MCC4882553.1 hypothetical protein [Vibrio splendidus]
MLHKTKINIGSCEMPVSIRTREGFVELKGVVEPGVLGCSVEFNGYSESKVVKTAINSSWHGKTASEAQIIVTKTQELVNYAVTLEDKITNLLDPEQAVILIGQDLNTDRINNSVLTLSLTPYILCELATNGNWNSYENKIDSCVFDAIVRCPAFSDIIDAVASIGEDDYKNTSYANLETFPALALDFMYGLFSKLPDEKSPIAHIGAGYEVIQTMLDVSASIRNGQSILSK